jgi:hypothetical protein
MPRSTRGPRPANGPMEDRKAIEQRARDAAAPFEPEKKGQWPFPVEEASEADNGNGANGRSGNAPSGQGHQPNQ